MKQSLYSAYEEKITEAEEKIYAKREEERDALREQLAESDMDVSKEMMEEMEQLISELGEEQMEQLEEAMDLVESLEVIDPHMSKEDLEELKRKHRASEEKALLKADMDYLKGMVKLQQKSAGIIGGMSGSGFTAAASAGAVPGYDPGLSIFSGGTVSMESAAQIAGVDAGFSGGFDVSI
jgi:SpoVK/Ycf46/Vps4 family AAA+-type ATPase